jgi:ketosteroid isomerase-like protein
MPPEFINQIFAAVDSKVSSRFLELLAPDVTFIYGNQAPVKGLAQVKAVVEQFNGSIKSMKHDIIGAYQCGDVWAVETRAHYEDRYGRMFSFPACNLITVRNDLVSIYKIFVDNSIMWQPPVTV